MAIIFGMIDQEFKITMIVMLRILMEKWNTLQTITDNAHRETETLRRNQKELLAI